VAYGPSWTTTTYFDHFNISPPVIPGGGQRAISLEGAAVYCSNGWFQVLDGNAHLYLLKDAGGNNPFLWLSNTGIDTGGNPAYTVIDINIGGPHRLLSWYARVSGAMIDGKIRWDDGTVVSGDGSNVVIPQWRFHNAKVGQSFYFDINLDQTGTIYNDASTPALSLRGKERTTGGAVPYLDFAGGHFRVPGVYGQALQFGATGALWRNATSGGLRYRGDFPYPGNDIDGVPITPIRKVVTYSGNMAIDASAGTIFVITATNGTAFIIANPSNPATNERITVQIINTSGGALGAVTWGAAYKLAAWTQPATGFSRAIDFVYDGTAWIEVSRTPADVPN
jgi:hypothetical protein